MAGLCELVPFSELVVAAFWPDVFKVAARDFGSKTQMSYLRPIQTLSELFAGLMITLSVTLAASVLSGGEADAKTALIGAIGANAAWGVIDAVLYVMNSAFNRQRLLRFAHIIASSADEAAALRRIEANWIPFSNW